ncbi:MAG: hypothetical protein PHQ04_09480 [Opitutaceae bacterium]|nr:hypothetical protein [Opitutaceae bacterium]
MCPAHCIDRWHQKRLDAIDRVVMTVYLQRFTHTQWAPGASHHDGAINLVRRPRWAAVQYG